MLVDVWKLAHTEWIKWALLFGPPFLHINCNNYQNIIIKDEQKNYNGSKQTKRVGKLTLAKALSFSELWEFSFLEFQTRATCTLPGNNYKFINLNLKLVSVKSSKQKGSFSMNSASNHFYIFQRPEWMCCMLSQPSAHTHHG